MGFWRASIAANARIICHMNTSSQNTNFSASSIDRFPAFDTVVSIKLYGSANHEAILQELRKRCATYENLFSRTIPTSDVGRINAAHGIATSVDERTFDLVSRALVYCRRSHGAFDVTIGAVSRLWDFKNGTAPGDEELARVIPHVNYRTIHAWRNDKSCFVRLDDSEAMIDLGGIAKGWIADELAAYLDALDITGYVLDLGGNILVGGMKPNGTPWVVGIRDPMGNGIIGKITISAGSMVTSGIYERSFAQGDRLAHHILDPHTGRPVPVTHPSVSVLCEQSVDAEGFSTTLLALGLEQSREYRDEFPEIIQAYFVNAEGTIELLR